MSAKPQGFPFRFFGREPEGEGALVLDYAVQLVAPLALASAQPATLEEAFASAIRKEVAAASATLRFDASHPDVVRAAITAPPGLARPEASKLVVRGLYAIHAIAPVAECVHLPSKGRGESAWDRRTREVQPEPAPSLLACSPGVPSSDPSLAAADAPAPRSPPAPTLSLTVLRGKTLPGEDPTAPFTSGHALAEARRMGAVVRADAARTRLLWHHFGALAEQAAGETEARVAADLGSRPLRAAYDAARAVPLDADRAVVAVRRGLLLLQREDGLLRPVCVRALPHAALVTLDATPSGLIVVGIAHGEPPRASLVVLAVDGDRLVPRTELAVDAETWGKAASIWQLSVERRDARMLVTASFASGGRVQKTVGLAELAGLDTEALPSPRAATPRTGGLAPALPHGASLACVLAEGAHLALVPTLETGSSYAAPVQRSIVHVAATRTTLPVPPGGYTALDVAPSGAVALVAQGVGHGTTRFFAVDGGEVRAERAGSPGCACFLDDERALIGCEIVRWRDGEVLGKTETADAVLALRDPGAPRVVTLTHDADAIAHAITETGLGPPERLARDVADLRATSTGVVARVDGAWRAV